MGKTVSALISGMVFGLGIAISGMANPAKVLNFFDIAGIWDPSLIFVMGGGLITTAIGYRILYGRRAKPIYEARYHLPTSRDLDVKLVGGSALFGVGWGIAGFCPGGAIPALGIGFAPTATFIGAMLVGMWLARLFLNRAPRPATA